MGSHFLDSLFAPKAIAVIGASERTDTVGGRVFGNLRDAGFTGPLYAVNPKYKHLHKQPCYSSITEMSEAVDLAVIATPAYTVPEIIHDCGAHGIRSVIIISAGFNVADKRGGHYNPADTS